MAENHPPSASASGSGDNNAPTRILLAVNQSSIKGYPHPSISSLTAFNWLCTKLIHPASRCNFKLLILHVQVPDEDAYDDMDSLYVTNDDFRVMQHEEKMRGIHLLQHFVNLCNQIELPCKAWIKKGDTRDIICKEVARVHPDMLVVGSRGLKTIQNEAEMQKDTGKAFVLYRNKYRLKLKERRMFVGTISEYCTKHADCPVLVIRRKAEDAPDDAVDD